MQVNFQEFSRQAIAAIAESNDSASAIDAVQQCAIKYGFQRTRYWSISHYRPTLSATDTPRSLVLSSFKCAPGVSSKYSIGLSIPANFAHLSTKRGNAIEAAHTHEYDVLRDERDRHLDRCLDLVGKQVLEVAVLSDAWTLEGVLALETAVGAVDVVSEIALSSIGKLLGQRVLLDTYSAEKNMAQAHPQGDTALQEVLKLSLKNIATQGDGRVGALFHWNWVEDSLTKIDEIVFPRGESDLPSRLNQFLSESYSPGEKYTGKAWSDRLNRHVFVLEGIQEGPDHPNIDINSLRYHEKLLGRVTSVLYGSLVNTLAEDLGGRYLIRLINSRRSSALPFVASNVRSVDYLCARASYSIREALNNERLRLLIALADASLTDVSETLECFASAAALEDVVNYMVLSGSSRSDLELVYASFQIDSVQVIKQLESLIDSKGLSFSGWSGLRQSSASAPLQSAGFKSVWTLPFESGGTHGQLVVASTSPYTVRRTRIARPPADSEAYLNACLRLLGRSLDAGRSEAMVEGAKKALGFIGHEMGTPFNQLSVYAYEATLLAEDAATMGASDRAQVFNPSRLGLSKAQQSPPPSRTLKEIRRKREAVEDRAAYIAALLRLAPIVALGTDRSLRLQLAKTSIEQVLHEAKFGTEQDPLLDSSRPVSDADMSDLESDQVSVVAHPWIIQLPAKDMLQYELVCDRYLLVVAVSGLLRNAVKFSIPRPGHGESIVRVDCEVQSGVVDFLVTNWGIGIPPDEKRGIFNAFTQGRMLETRRATRGMGLGLYLSSNIAEAHSGELRLLRSEPVDYDDPRRVQAYEGYMTSFRLRVRRGLQEGPVQYEISKKRLSGRTN